MCETQVLYLQLVGVAGLPTSGSQVQTWVGRVLVDLECRASAYRNDPDSDFGSSYWLYLGEWMRGWVGRN